MITILLIENSSLLFKLTIIGGSAFVRGGLISYFVWNVILKQKKKGH